ncbi:MULTISPECIES: ATP-binding protein [unclassified Achromobacter]|uniref:ATP-binding protein n=1 Tax=unclassified Achromobacter TaxID=2626865 RepID=UPI001C48CF23|nr:MULTISPECIES: ATP-binding protein [unclassified Achromobacter]MBV7500413.1 ATP-binding protein [Achromobacter sp. ACM05]
MTRPTAADLYPSRAPQVPKENMGMVNPYTPGAGHSPPFLAGRANERADAERYFDQTTILCNVVLTGLRGVGKTVLLEDLRRPARERGWHWVSTDLSESASVSEENMVTRLLADLSVATSGYQVIEQRPASSLVSPASTIVRRLDHQHLLSVYQNTPGLIGDKLKAVLELSWEAIKAAGGRGIVFAYDEAQNLADHAQKEQYPLSMLLDTFQSIQRKGVPYMLLLTGLPTLFPKLVEARTYSERMFHVITLDRLEPADSEAAITKPIANSPMQFTQAGIEKIVEVSGGYPYFIQFICRECYDLVLRGETLDDERFTSIVAKLDNDFFSGRWARATDRQRDLMTVIANLPNAEMEFSVQEIVEASKTAGMKSFSNSHVNQMLGSLVTAGLVFKNRYGRYAFAVPLLSHFILRQADLQDRL